MKEAQSANTTGTEVQYIQMMYFLLYKNLTSSVYLLLVNILSPRLSFQSLKYACACLNDGHFEFATNAGSMYKAINCAFILWKWRTAPFAYGMSYSIVKFKLFFHLPL